jgi:S1-C subfamily serine protease
MKFSGKEASTAAALLEELKKKAPGEEVTLEIQRGKDTMTVKVVAGRKQSA